MDYDITIPIKIALFSLSVTYLLTYFLWLAAHVKKYHDKKIIILFVAVNMLIMIISLLLTGFAVEL